MKLPKHISIYLRICLGLLLLAFGVDRVLGQTPYPADVVGHALDKARSLSRVGSFQVAELLLQSAISNLHDMACVGSVELRNEIGQVHESELRMDEAEKDYRQSIRLNLSLSNPSLIDLVVSSNDLGTIFQARHQSAPAEMYFRRALSLLETNHLEREPITGSVLTNLAMSIQRQGRYSEAAALYEKGLKQLKEGYGENTAEYSKALRNFGFFQFEIGRYIDALQIQRQAYKIETSLPFIRNIDKAVSINNLVLTLIELGNFAEAESLLRGAIELERSSPKVDAPLVNSLNSLGVVEGRVGRLAQARAYETEALKIALQTLSDTDPLIATLWHNLGNTAVAEGRLKEARGLYGEAAAAWLRDGGENLNYAATIASLGSLERKQRHHKQALALYTKALRLDESLLDENHPRVASDLSNVAVEMYSQRKFKESLQLFARAKQIQEKAFGSDNIAVARTWRELGMIETALKQLQQAEEAYANAIRISRRSENDSAELMSWLYEYADLLRKEQKFGAAEEAAVQAYGIHVHTIISAHKHSDQNAGAPTFK